MILPPALAAELIPDGEQRREGVTLRAGGRTAGIRLQGADGEGPDGAVRVTGDVVRLLCLPLGRRSRPLRLRPEGGGLHVGPVVGIFTTRRGSTAVPFGLDTPLVARMCRLGAARGMVVYGFTPRDVRWRDRTVRGWVYVRRGRWARRIMPFPDAVYDRVPSRRLERRAGIRRVKGRLREILGDRYFNREFFDKWRVHALLAEDPDYGHMVPRTALYRGVDQLRTWLRAHRTVWLKPSGGSQGKGIVVIRRRPGGYAVYRLRDEVWRRRHVRSLVGAARLARRCTRRRRYVIQEGLHLSRYRGRPFDVRILMQKNGDGQWVWTKTVARVAGRGSVTSNISTGGLGRSFTRVAGRASGRVRGRRARLAVELRETAHGLAGRIEERLGYRLGEIALDLGIDVQGKIWFIEANSKPFRITRAPRSRQGPVRRSLVRPLLYAAHVAGFATGE